MGSWLTGNDNSANDPTPPATALRIQTSVQGRAITILWGTQRVAANLIWQGGFASRQVQVGSVGSNSWIDHIFSKAQPIFQTFYSTSCLFALAHGTVDELTAGLRAWNGTTASSLGGLGFTLLRGDFLQAPWTYLTSAFPAAAFNYRGTALAGAANFDLGTSADLPVLNWEVQSDIAGFGPTGQDADAADVVLDLVSNTSYGVNFPFYRMDQELTGYYTYNAASGMAVSPIITEQVSTQSFLSDLFEATNSSPRWSSGKLSVVPWGDTALTSGAVTLLNNVPLVIPPTNAGSTLYPQIQVAQSRFVDDQGVTGFTLVPISTLPAAGQYNVTVDGLYTFNPSNARTNVQISYHAAEGYSYTPNTTAIYDLVDDDFQPNQTSNSTAISGDEPIAWAVKRQSDMLNDVKYEFLDRSNNYDPVAADVPDEASITTYGSRPTDLKTRHMFALANAAQASAALEVIREQIPATCGITLGPEFILLDVEDIVTLSRAVMGLDRQSVRTVEIQENDDGTMSFTNEVFMGTSAAPLFGTQANNGTNNDFLIDPGPVTDVVIFTAPDALAAPPTGQVTVIAAVSGSNQFYGGANVYFSTDGVNYNAVGVVAQSTMGRLTAVLPDHAGLDTINTLSVDLSESFGVLPASSHTNADSGLPVVFVDNELLSYGDSTLTSAFNYDNTYLQRAEYTSTHKAHAKGSSFVLVDNSPFRLNLPTSFIGQTVYFKFQSFNIFQGGLEDISLSVVYPYVVGAPVANLIPISTTLAANGQLLAGGVAAKQTTTLAATGNLIANMRQRLLAASALSGNGTLIARMSQTLPISASLAANGAMSAVTLQATIFDSGSLTNATLSGANLTASHTNTSNGGARSAAQKNAGKFYMEATLTTVNGLVSTLIVLTAAGIYNDFITGPINGAGPFTSSGSIWSGGSNSGKSLGTLHSGDIIGMAVDLDADLIWFRKAPSGDWNGDPAADPATGAGGVSISAYSATTLSPAVTFSGNASETITANFGLTGLSGTVPSGFLSGWTA